MAINRYFKNIEEARDFIRESAKVINPHKVVIKEKRLNIVVGNKNDYDLLTQGLVGMKNVKWIYITLEEVA
tara:strand:- start:209 stop:421 length:213 start_codon:yes stop_codon:yes gene_type:complete